MDLLMILRLTQCKKMGDRINGLLKCLKNWGIPQEALTTPATELALSKYEAYRTLQNENCKMYEEVKNEFISALGFKTFYLIRDYTNYLVRDSVMIKTHRQDRCVENMVELITEAK